MKMNADTANCALFSISYLQATNHMALKQNSAEIYAIF